VGARLRDVYREAQRIPLGDWIVAYGKSLEAREVTEQHRLDRVGALEEFANDTGAKGLSDLTLDRAQAWLAEVRKQATRRRGPRSARDVNRRRSALREFTLWLVKGGRLLGDPLAALAPLNEAADRRHVRCALKLAEVAALLAAARRRPDEELKARAGVEAEGRARTGRARRRPSEVSEGSRARAAALGRLHAQVYALATGTGLRRGERGRLPWQDLVLDDNRGHVLVTAASAKSREAQSVPLRSDVLVLPR